MRAWVSRSLPPLVLTPIGSGRSRIELVPETPAGQTFGPRALEQASAALAHRDGARHDIHPRLLEVLYRAVRHFRAPYVNVVSGYRPGRATSRHTQGRAIDFALPGVPDRRLAAYLRPQGFVGVGLYTVSGFVHLDVRARSYFWTDSSAPGQPNRERPVLERTVGRYDASARRRGEQPVPDVARQSESDDGSGETQPDEPADEPGAGVEDAGVGG